MRPTMQLKKKQIEKKDIVKEQIYTFLYPYWLFNINQSYI